MTAELERYDDNGGALAERRPPELAILRPATVGRLEDWAKSAHAAHQIATSLVKTSFVPEAFRDKPHEATAAILAGDEVGLSPMASLRAFDIIQGTAAPRAITHRAVVQAAGHEVWLVEATDNRCVMRGRRHGSDVVQESVWTIERARSLNLTGKHNWKVQPKAMLIARATSECCRLVASDALMGMAYSIEELTDEIPGGAESPAGARRTAQRRQPPKPVAPAPAASAAQDAQPAPVAAGLPPLPGEPGSDEAAEAAVAEAEQEQRYVEGEQHVDNPADVVDMRKPNGEPAAEPAADDSTPATSAQTKKLFAILRQTDVDSTADRHKVTSRILGREITSWAQLSKDDASALIDALELIQEKGDLTETLADLLIDDAPPAAEGEK